MTNLTKKVMRRVYMIWGVRYVAPRVLLSIGFFWAAFKLMAQNFFVAKIFSNFMTVAFSSVWAIPKFITSALNSAEPQVLVMVSAAGIAGFFLAVNLLRNVRSIIANKNFSAVFEKSK